MAKKRKSDATRLDEVDRGMYTAFCGAANSLSQLYSQAVSHQRISFHAGERHAMEKLYSWISRQQENGIRVMPGDVLAYLQNELDLGTEETPSLPFLPQQQSQTATQPTLSGIPVSSNAFGGQGLRSDQAKNTVFSNALSGLQHFHLSQGGAVRSNDNSRDPNPPSSDSSSMEMHDPTSAGNGNGDELKQHIVGAEIEQQRAPPLTSSVADSGGVPISAQPRREDGGAPERAEEHQKLSPAPRLPNRSCESPQGEQLQPLPPLDLAHRLQRPRSREDFEAFRSRR